MTRIFTTTDASLSVSICAAVLRLTRRYSAERVDAACRTALASRVRSPRYAHLRPTLENRQDHTTRPSEDAGGAGPAGYVRGADYYARGQR